MERLTISLPLPMKNALKRRARQEKKSVSKLVGELLATTPIKEDKKPVIGLGTLLAEAGKNVQVNFDDPDPRMQYIIEKHIRPRK